MVDVLRGKDRDAQAGCQFGHRIEPLRFIGVVTVGEHGGDFNPLLEQGPDAHTADIVIGQYNRFHNVFSSH
jgi:hypothetical protein